MPLVALVAPFRLDPAQFALGRSGTVCDLANGVHQATNGRYQFRLLGLGPPVGQWQPSAGIAVRNLEPAYSPIKPWDAPSWQLLDQLDDVDIIHLLSAESRTAEMVTILSRISETPLILTELGEPGIIAAELQTWRLAAAFVNGSDFASKHWPNDAGPSLTVHGVDLSVFQTNPAVQRQAHLLYVDEFRPALGLDRVLQRLPNELPLVCLGDSADADYTGWLRQLASGKQVRFGPPPSLEQLAAEFQQAAALICPATHLDGLGRSHPLADPVAHQAARAVACATSVIARNSGAMVERVTPGLTGWLVDSDEEMIAVMQAAVTRPQAITSPGAGVTSRVAAGGALAEFYDATLNRSAKPVGRVA